MTILEIILIAIVSGGVMYLLITLMLTWCPSKAMDCGASLMNIFGYTGSDNLTDTLIDDQSINDALVTYVGIDCEHSMVHLTFNNRTIQPMTGIFSITELELILAEAKKAKLAHILRG